MPQLTLSGVGVERVHFPQNSGDRKCLGTLTQFYFLRIWREGVFQTPTGKVVSAFGARMIKLVYCITKKAGLTDEEFFRYWKDIHSPIGIRIPGVRKLVQSHRRNVPEDKHKPDFDGMAELWFDDAEALLAARQSPEWKASTDDEVNFIDHSQVAYFVSEEHVIIDGLKPEK